MTSRALKEFRSTLHMPEVGDLRFYISKPYFEDRYDGKLEVSCFNQETARRNILLRERLPVIDAFMDTMPLRRAALSLVGPRNASFHLGLYYDAEIPSNHPNPFMAPFRAAMSPRHRLNYPQKGKGLTYSGWQERLRELLTELDL